MPRRRRIGIVGYGKLGQFLTQHILENDVAKARFELAFVWNRSAAILEEDPKVPAAAILRDLSSFAEHKADIIVEVAHPDITKQYGEAFLSSGADYMCGSPTAFADPALEEFAMQQAAKNGWADTGGALYIPSGALWGVQDIQRMACSGALAKLSVTMRWHPDALRLCGDIADDLKKLQNLPEFEGKEHLLYCGPTRPLCTMAPNNVNTIACAALSSGAAVGFDATLAKIYVDTSLEAHVIEIDIEGPIKFGDKRLRVSTQRINPAKPGEVTGSATYASFFGSVLQAGGRGPGLHFC